MKLQSALALMVCVALIGACGNLPRPFRDGPRVTTGNLLLDVPTAVGIAVLPVRGAPSPMDTRISSAVASRLQSLEIPAEAVPENAGLGFTLQGEAHATDDTSVVVTWSLRSRRGETVRTYRQVVTAPAAVWQSADEVLAARLGNEAAIAIGDMLNGIAPPAQGPTQAAAPPQPAYPSVSVKPVEGAPGDGRESLRLAVLQALNLNGVARDDVNPGITLTCQFTVSPFEANLQKVEIVWHAISRDGADMGTVKLDNTIPVGALDGVWGPTAFAIADAAINDLLTLLASKAPAQAKP